MKRFGIYFTVILFFWLGGFLRGFSQNSKIESIQMTYPIQDTINDPKLDSLIIQVSLDSYFTWEDSPPDSIGFFSLDNDYSWTERTVTNTTLFQGEYKAVTSAYDFVNEINTVYFWLKDEVAGIDTTTSYEITYNKPQVKEVTVNSADNIPGTSDYIVYTKNPELFVKAGSWFTSEAPASFISRIELTDLSTSLTYTLWESTGGESLKEVTTALPGIFTLEAGTTRCFSVVAIGKTALGFPGIEASEPFNFCLTLMSIEVPDTICQVNSLIALEALPAGGSFSGAGIVDNTNYFNPSLANANTYNSVTYTHMIGGAEFSVSKEIYVVNLPVINLDGNLEVCANSTDVVYTITNAETSKYIYNWEFTGVAEVLSETPVSRTVRWDSDPESYTGRIRITLEGKNETECPAVFDYLVDIDPDDAPDKPCVCFGDNNRRLLLCSNINAVYYEWYTDLGDSLGVTEKPYFYLTDDLVKYHHIDNTTIFRVDIANQLTGCYTTGYMCEEQSCEGAELNNLKTGLTGDELALSMLSNPTHNDLNINISGYYTGTVILQIVNLNGMALSTITLNKVQATEDYKLGLDPGVKPGIYLVTCRYGKNLASPAKLIVY